MRYRTIGGTGLSVSEIGFGCGGNAGLMLRGNAAEQERVVARALALGINYFDIAPDYGDGLAETNLGRVLRALRERPLIASKVEIRAADLDDIAGHVVRSVEASLARLRVDRLDILQIHNGPADPAPRLAGAGYGQLWVEDFLRPGGALDGLRRIVEAGKARVLGFVCRGDDIEPVRRLLDTGAFHMLNLHYTLLNPTAAGAGGPALGIERDFGGVLGETARRGVAAAVYSPLASGALTGAAIQGGPRHPLSGARDHVSEAFGRSLEAAPAFAFLAEEGGTLAQAAFRFVLGDPRVTTVLGGFSSIEQLDELAATSDLGPLPAALTARIESVWRRELGSARR